MKYFIYGILVVIILLGGYIGYILLTTRSHSPADVVIFQDDDFLLTIDYCRPSKKGRLIFGNEPEEALVPYGKYWRTGANEATEIEFNRDISVSGNSLAAGRYRLYTVPDEEEWIIAFNSELEKWGYNEPDYSQDVLRIRAVPIYADTVCEQFLITAKPVQTSQLEIKLHWDETLVPFSVNY